MGKPKQRERTVLFVRTPIGAASEITIILQNLDLAGWDVVSHAESEDEYSFVLKSRML